MSLSVTGFGTAAGLVGSLLIFDRVSLRSWRAIAVVVVLFPQDHVVAMSELLKRWTRETGAPVAATGILGGLAASKDRLRGVCKRIAPE